MFLVWRLLAEFWDDCCGTLESGIYRTFCEDETGIEGQLVQTNDSELFQ